MPKKRPVYIGEFSGDNVNVTPTQLLEMIQEECDREDSATKVQGLFAVVVREAEDGTLHLENFRCGLPKFVEVAVVSRTWQRIVGTVTQD